MRDKLITVFGGSGFLGKHVIESLLKDNFLVRLITSKPDVGNKLKVFGNPGYLQVIEGDINQGEKLFDEWIGGSSIVINMIGSFKDKDKIHFSYLHSKVPEEIAKACKKQSVEAFIHLSNLGIEAIPTIYSKSRALGEQTTLRAFDRSVVLKPSLIYGDGDSFITILAKYAKQYSVLPLISGGKTKLQPINVKDLTQIIVDICNNNSNYSGSYNIGGKEILSMKEIYSLFEKILNKKIYKIYIPFFLSKAMVFFINMKVISPVNRIIFGTNEPPFSSEQIEMIEYDNTIFQSKDNLANIMNINMIKFEDGVIDLMQKL